MAFNLSVTVLSAKAVCSQGVTPFFLHLAPLAGEVGAKRRVRGTVRETGPVELTLPLPAKGGERKGEEKPSGWHARGLFDDRETHAGLVAVFFRDLAPALFGFLAGLERAFDLGRAFHELVEVHRAELAANHPEIAALCHHSLLTYSAA